MIKLEHANISVTDSQPVTDFLLAAFPEFRVRGSGIDTSGIPWCHVGGDDFYVAISSLGDEVDKDRAEENQRSPDGNQVGLNHLGWEVDDIDSLKARMIAAGYVPYMEVDDHPARRRVYFYDPTGGDWEFVQYLTRATHERNHYDS